MTIYIWPNMIGLRENITDDADFIFKPTVKCSKKPRQWFLEGSANSYNQARKVFKYCSDQRQYTESAISMYM